MYVQQRPITKIVTKPGSKLDGIQMERYIFQCDIKKKSHKSEIRNPRHLSLSPPLSPSRTTLLTPSILQRFY